MMRFDSPKSATPKQILVLDDDRDARGTLSEALSSTGQEVICCADGTALLTLVRKAVPSCILLELELPGKSGLEILKELRQENCLSPILMISARGDIPSAVAAIKCGAFDFIQKPLRGCEIVASVNRAIEDYAHSGLEIEKLKLDFHFPGQELLTPREREILEKFAFGFSNKEVGRLLGRSSRTIEDHRANIMRKLGAKNAVDLIRMITKTANPQLGKPTKTRTWT
jgi:FixJ family two-component response regulator